MLCRSRAFTLFVALTGSYYQSSFPSSRHVFIRKRFILWPGPLWMAGDHEFKLNLDSSPRLPLFLCRMLYRSSVYFVCPTL
ncbi:hypothetical protein B0H12DRAFT_1156953 [Mycena haematopus]|nr:hypothetical protein B0H12DRAFT_1156953 [Mycena haematopus]